MYGLVLEGGGGRGAYQIGACKAMQEMGIGFSGVAGTSVGSLNGAMIVQDEIDKAYELWYDIDPSKVVKFTEEETKEFSDPGLKGKNFNIKIKRLKKIIVEKGLDVEPLVETVTSVIDENKIRSSGKDFGIVTFDLTNRKALEIFIENIPRGKLVDYLIASASFPGFKLKVIDGRLFIDGGVYNSLPINLVRDKGYKDIIVVRTFALGRERKVDTEGLNLTYITPSENLGSMLDFGRERARKNLKMGYYDALRVFDKLMGNMYYIKPLKDKDFFVKYLMGLEEEKIRRISDIFGIEKRSGKRVLFEYIIPKIADLLGLPEDATYEDICIALIENIARVSGIERFKIYTFKELFSEIADKYKPSKDEFVKEIPGFLRKMDLVSKIVKDQIISSIAKELLNDVISPIAQ